MLRLLVLLLVLANAGYFGWTHGLLAPYGFAPVTQSEPQRLAQQLHPEALRILTPVETRQLDAAVTGPVVTASGAVSATPTECLQAGLFNEEQTATLRSRLQGSLPEGSWALESSVEPARWMVYMGKYSSLDAVNKKKSELRQLHVNFDALNNAALEPGLSLGVFGSKDEADNAMAGIAKRGVRTAKVIQSQPEVRGQRLKLAAVDTALRPQLDAIKPQLAGKVLQACRAADAAKIN